MSADGVFVASASEIEGLRAALLSSDKQTQSFLGPLLPSKTAQQVLLSFLRDPSRSFEDWVWEPSVHQLLDQLRDPQANNQSQDVDRWFERAVQDQRAYKQAHNELSSEQFPNDADKAQEDGKAKFKRRDFYAAKNAFKKSLRFLTTHMESEYYGEPVDVKDWDEPAKQERFVTLCNNIAICGIKMNDVSTIKEYAQKALAVDLTSSKALYAMAKLHLMEHMYEEAYAVVDRALQHEPENQLLVKFRTEIDQARKKAEKDQVEIAVVAKQKRAETDLQEQQQLAQQKKWKEMRVTARDFVPLPTREEDPMTVSRLHTYFMRIKHDLRVDIKQLHDPDNSEPPLFECTMADDTAGVILVAGVKASSKKLVKSECAKVAIKKLWELKIAAGTLLEEDAAYLVQFEKAQRDGTPMVSPSSVPKSCKPDGGKDTSCALPVKIAAAERSIDPVMLLNQLNQQKRLQVQFEFEDLSPTSKESTEFQCTTLVNGEPLGVAKAPSKKKARNEAARQAIAMALEKNFICHWDPEESDEEAAQQS